MSYRDTSGASCARTRRVVVKIGSSVLSGDDGDLDRARIAALSRRDRRRCTAHGREVVVVSSGAVAAGIGALGLAQRPKTIPHKQAAAAVGQIGLMALYEAASPARASRSRRSCSRTTTSPTAGATSTRGTRSRRCSSGGVVPIVNENDTVVVEEIKLGDNDNLSALVATLVEADLLVILSDVAGLYTADPRHDADATLVPLVDRRHARDRGVAPAAAARSAPAAWRPSSPPRRRPRRRASRRHRRRPRAGVLPRSSTRSADVGTLFLPVSDRLARRKHWIAYTLKPGGTLVVDDGARGAIIAPGPQPAAVRASARSAAASAPATASPASTSTAGSSPAAW